MLQKAQALIEALRRPDTDHTALRIIPELDLQQLIDHGSASIDLRLGRWFLVLRESKTPSLTVVEDSDTGTDHSLTRSHFVPFGGKFILHPGKFVLGATLEWVRLPSNLGGHITGKSSWGRKGLVIETAAGVHPGFTGCLTLELANMGEVPIDLHPGVPICQIMLHLASDDKPASPSQFFGKRRPVLGKNKVDPIFQKLRKPI